MPPFAVCGLAKAAPALSDRGKRQEFSMSQMPADAEERGAELWCDIAQATRNWR